MRCRPQGFTLVELLIVIVILGILASVAIPKYGQTRENAYLAAMKSDLRNLVTAQEAYFIDNDTYYDGVLPAAAIEYRSSTAVTVTLQDVSAAGWAAVSKHTATPTSCALFAGSAPAAAPATVEGQVDCG